MSSLCRRCWRRGVQMPPPRPPIQARSAWYRIDIYSMAAGIHNPKHWKPKQLLHVLDTLQNNVEASTICHNPFLSCCSPSVEACLACIPASQRACLRLRKGLIMHLG
ncbi:conserved hypothetical protein [Coccidioides posadasii str. Silveira]|uniref:Uncharacterized protein n=1 Tax=Coccidioides posadasii (strain RMSCC 757 / Silveira) TaxID=443226 RepID=E9DC76_COCPS|nr:conserved hypothetical protein [Coccidioides posadasii str. Silveira]